jgi:hypothetical protein
MAKKPRATPPFDVDAGASDVEFFAGEPFRVVLTFDASAQDTYTLFHDAWLIYVRGNHHTKWTMVRFTAGAWSASGTNKITVYLLPADTPENGGGKEDASGLIYGGTGTGTVFGSSASGPAGTVLQTYQCPSQLANL